MPNTDLCTARSNKADEFYTEYADIEKEISYYENVFEDKVVYCPCDDYQVSNFYKFFKDNFIALKLKRLIATSYSEDSFGMYCEFDGFIESFYTLDNNGDFASDVCKSIMQISDIVVTNPPFSKFRQFITQLIDLQKDFIILGNINAVSYKEVFKYIVNQNILLGPSIHAGDRKFRVPDDYPLDGTACTIEDGIKYIRVKGVRWFTNVKFSGYTVKHTVLNNIFDNTNYQKFDNYDAINVNSMKEIPYDYLGEIGAPITVLDKMNESGDIEFLDKNNNLHKYRLVGQLNSGNKQNFDFAKPVIDGKCKFKRVVIQHI